jgi:hypothetical protein
MRTSLRRTLLDRPHILSRPSFVCNRRQSPFHLRRQSPFPSQIQRYSNDVKPTDEDESPGVESTGTVPNYPDIITTEAPEIQEQPPSPNPPSNPTSQDQRRLTKQPWAFRTVESKKKDSATRAKELAKAISQTSLRKNVHWYPPLQGVNPAYDMALFFLNNDRMKKIASIQRLQKRIDHERKSIPCIHQAK